MRARQQAATGYLLHSMRRFCFAVFATPQMMLHERHQAQCPHFTRSTILLPRLPGPATQDISERYKTG
jgi:hypothetical protein